MDHHHCPYKRERERERQRETETETETETELGLYFQINPNKSSVIHPNSNKLMKTTIS